jgi:hypothetical protein
LWDRIVIDLRLLPRRSVASEHCWQTLTCRESPMPSAGSVPVDDAPFRNSGRFLSKNRVAKENSILSHFHGFLMRSFPGLQWSLARSGEWKSYGCFG